MTERLRAVPSSGQRRKRASRGALRAWTWVVGSLSFLLPTAVLATAPKPAASAVPATASPQPPVVIIHHIVRRVVVQSAPRVVTVGAPTMATSVAVAPPAASTGGSHP